MRLQAIGAIRLFLLAAAQCAAALRLQRQLSAPTSLGASTKAFKRFRGILMSQGFSLISSVVHDFHRCPSVWLACLLRHLRSGLCRLRAVSTRRPDWRAANLVVREKQQINKATNTS